MAAGLGPLLDTHTHLLWLRGGCFGLVAAAGLEGAVRTRIRREQLTLSAGAAESLRADLAAL